MEPRYQLRLMFGWGGGCLWCDNEAARGAFDVEAIEDKLSLSPSLLNRLEEWSLWHDGALDWDGPAGPSLWSPVEQERFELVASKVLAEVRMELGTEYQVVYKPL